MKKESNREKHLNYFKTELLNYVLSNCPPNTLTAELIDERAENATEIYFSVILSGETSAYAYDKARQLLYLGLW